MLERADDLAELLRRVDAARSGLVEPSQLRQALARACGVALSDGDFGELWIALQVGENLVVGGWWVGGWMRGWAGV
jgi:hypothetical protein